MALTTTNIAQDLNNVTVPAPAGGESDLQQVRGATNITNNGNNTFTLAANDDVGNNFGSLTFTYVGQETVSGSNFVSSGYFAGATSATVPVVSFVFSGETLYSYVLAFDPTHVLLIGLAQPTTAGAPFTQNANRFLLTTNGPDPRTSPLTVATTGPSYTPPCFVAGTRIATPTGAVPVESLAAGDLVTTVTGEARAIVWAGHRTLRVSAQPNPELVRPVVIRAGAFGAGLPSRDLTVSADHNVFVDAVLIPAKCLVNGRNVLWSELETVTYHHIELAEHDVVFAEDLPTETYLEVGNRSAFAGQPVVDAHPDFSTAPDTNYFAWEARGYAPLVVSGPVLETVRARLAAEAETAATAVRKVA